MVDEGEFGVELVVDFFGEVWKVSVCGSEGDGV